MTKIILNPWGKTALQPPVLDVGASEVTIKEAFNGIMFKTDAGERLSVFMRDNGFVVTYSGDFGSHGFNAGVISFRDGDITPHGKAFSETPLGRTT